MSKGSGGGAGFAPQLSAPVGPRRHRALRVWAAGATVLVLALIAAEIALATSTARLEVDARALAHVKMPLGGGTIEHVIAATNGPRRNPIPVRVKGTRIWPRKSIAVGRLVAIEVVVKRPGLLSWLTGSTQRVQLRLRTPRVSLRSPYLSLSRGSPVGLRFSGPVAVIRYGQAGAMRRRALPSPQRTVDLPRAAEAGSELVSGVPRSWESSPPATAVSWFPARAQGPLAMATPAPGSRIGPDTPIKLTFSRPVSQVLGHHLPRVSPNTSGRWRRAGSHAIVFTPSGYGYGLGTTVKASLPATVKLVGAGAGRSRRAASWPVPAGSTLRLQQILAQLGYLPVTWKSKGGAVADTPAAQAAAAVHPPQGRFSWLYPHVPGSLRAMWAPGTYGSMTKGAVMAFENDHGMPADGIAGPAVWRALITAANADKRATFGYTYVMVDKATQRLKLWHDGLTLVTAAVNTGIASSPTAAGTFEVYEHIASGTMSGTDPSGSHYDDPNVPWISYFNGGDALHGFYRAQYGYPQSLGCVEMPPNTAEAVWKYTPIGTLVNVA